MASHDILSGTWLVCRTWLLMNLLILSSNHPISITSLLYEGVRRDKELSSLNECLRNVLNISGLSFFDILFLPKITFMRFRDVFGLSWKRNAHSTKHWLVVRLPSFHLIENWLAVDIIALRVCLLIHCLRDELACEAMHFHRVGHHVLHIAAFIMRCKKCGLYPIRVFAITKLRLIIWSWRELKRAKCPWLCGPWHRKDYTL